jgi:phosphonate transport system substrate-binding protein
MLNRRRFLIGLPGASLGVGAGLAQTQSPLRIGLTPVFLDNEWQVLDAFAEHIRITTGRSVEFVQRRTYKEVVALLLLGELDTAWLCGFPLLQYAGRLHALALPVWNGAPRYQAYVIAADDRNADDLGSLRGDIHAYSDPDSNSGHLVTVAELLARGERPESFFAQTFYTFGHRNVVHAVARRLAQSGSVDGYVYEALTRTEPDLLARTRVVWRSEWHGFPPFVVTTEARDSQASRDVADALFRMTETPQGRDVLDMLQLDGFTEPRPDSFDSIAALMARVADRG